MTTMAQNSKKEQVIMLGREHKILMLTILKQGFMTESQKQELSSLFDVKMTKTVFITNQEGLKEYEKIFKDVLDDYERKNSVKDTDVIPSGFVELPNL